MEKRRSPSRKLEGSAMLYENDECTVTFFAIIISSYGGGGAVRPAIAAIGGCDRHPPITANYEAVRVPEK